LRKGWPSVMLIDYGSSASNDPDQRVMPPSRLDQRNVSLPFVPCHLPRGRAAHRAWPVGLLGRPCFRRTPPNRCRRVSFPGSKVLGNIYKKEFAMSPNRQRSSSWRSRVRDPALTTMLAVQCIIIFVSPFAAMGYEGIREALQLLFSPLPSSYVCSHAA
jgi:hypothetical protein